MSTRQSPIIYILCLYLVGTAIYSLSFISWSAPLELLVKAMIFQGLKISAGIALIFKQVIGPYLLSAILIWAIIVTGLGFQVSPLSEQSMSDSVFVMVNILFFVVVVLYSFSLKRKGYFERGLNA